MTALALLSIAAATRFCARLRAQSLSGGSFFLPISFFAAAGGGDTLTGGSMSLLQVIGQGQVAPMGGGTFQLQPGLAATQPAAQLDLSGVHAFPDPFKPALGHDRITFRGLTADATIRVYTLAGELVTTLSKSDPTSNDLVWRPVVNTDGQPLASGVYFYVVAGDSGKATGKLMVIK